ncbi:MAG: N-acetylmuramoyl-L-alanine amidase [Thermodesulfovibrionales bacterium]|nr:N-acetylmuramoyl-L-alanine amidase [Thermodesulfovibrionales bacterium]
MKKKFLILFILFVSVFPLSAQQKVLVSLKFSSQGNTLRVVLEAEESFLKRTKVTTSSTQIKADFPEPYTFTPPQGLPFELLPAEKSLILNFKEKGETKIFQLSSPARLVFDIQKSDIQKKELSAEKQRPVLARGLCIDAGHGGFDFGITYGNASEKEIMLSLAKDLASFLAKQGKKSFLTRRADQYISISERINFVNQKVPDVFISLHSSTSTGFVLYSPRFEEQASVEAGDFYSLSSRQRKYVQKSKALAESIGKALKDEFKAEIIQREMPLPILNSVASPCMLVELPSPKYVLYDQQMREKVIKAFIHGVAAYEQ